MSIPNRRQIIAASMRADRATYREIAEALGVSVSRASQLAESGARLCEPDEVVWPAGLRPTTPVKHLRLSRRARAGLVESGIETFGQILSAEPIALRRKLLRIPNVGRKSVEELEAMVDAHKKSAPAETEAPFPEQRKPLIEP